MRYTREFFIKELKKYKDIDFKYYTLKQLREMLIKLTLNDNKKDT